MLILTVGRSRLELILIEYNALDLRSVEWGFTFHGYLIQGEHHGAYVGCAWCVIEGFANQIIIAALPFSRGESRFNVANQLLRSHPLLGLCDPGYHLLAVLRFLLLLLDRRLSLLLLCALRIWAFSNAKTLVLWGRHQDLHGWLLLRVAFLLYYHIPSWGACFSSRWQCFMRT
jgi:hypothetical protein